MPFLASTQNRSSRVLSTSGPILVALEQFAPKQSIYCPNSLDYINVKPENTHFLLIMKK